MTLGEGKKKVYELLDEYSAGGTVETDEDIELKMADFFDMAQKDVAKYKRIVKTKKINREAGRTEYSMPADMEKLYRVWVDGRVRNNRYDFRAGRIIIPMMDPSEEIIIEYFAIPETISAETEDSYEFELPDDACNLLPYFVAAQQLLPDLVMDYQAPWMIYQNMLAQLDKSLPGQNTGLRQSFYR